MRAPDPALIERFREDLEGAAGLPIGGGDLALAVSGGPDSMAMLALAQAAFPGQVIAATVDHGLRPEAASEAAMVARHCAVLDVPHVVLTVTDPLVGASVQALARDARYRLLAHWAAGAAAMALLTAHHADDQAETLLMRAARGSGLSGLAAIRARREHAVDATRILVLRPLLGWRRSELRRIADATGSPYVDDPSNADEDFDRTRFRKLFEANPWLDVARMARTVAHLAEAEQALTAGADLLWEDRAASIDGEVRIDVEALPRELRRRLARRAIAEVRARANVATPEWSEAASIEPLLDALEGGGGASQAGVMASAQGANWRFRPAPPRRSH